ncbi:MAG: signal peptidase II [Burkholderiaceae bacterium]
MPEARPESGTGRWLALAVLVVVLDQLSKFWVLQSFALHERRPVINGLFDLTLVFNPGAAFSFLAEHDGWQRWFFTILGIAAALFIIHLLRRANGMPMYAAALSLILGGAVGNVVDRLVHGEVVDFLLFYQHPWYFPAFNLADSAITLGAVLLILDELQRWRRERAQAQRRPAEH